MSGGLWRFALDIYGRPGVEPLLLELQDRHGQSVPFLLWRLWMAAEARPADHEILAAAAELARGWEMAATGPLRTLRRAQAAGVTGAPAEALQALRAKVKALELEAERMLLEMLEARSPPPSGQPAPTQAALEESARVWGRAAPPELIRRLSLALA